MSIVLSTQGHARRSAGFTLIELMCALAIAAIVAGVAYPGYRSVVHKVHRSEALAALLNVQMTQERYRAARTSYGSLSDIGVAAATASGRYTLTMVSANGTGFEVLASASGSQRADAKCRHLKLTVDGLQVSYASGPDTSVGNDPSVNRGCWGL